MKCIEILGAKANPLTMGETIQLISRRLDNNVMTQHVVVNVAKLVNMRKDSALRESVESCDIINIDGMGVVWGGRFLGYDIPERVAGIDLFLNLLALAELRGESVFLLGAKQDVLEKAVNNIKKQYPKLVIAGWYHGYFWDDEESVVKKIANSKATMLFVAISSPKKECFINKWKERLGVKFVMGVGGTFDVVAGITKRAPPWMQRIGMEWLYRVLQEPRRMWQRYLVTNTKFLWLLLLEKVKK